MPYFHKEGKCRGKIAWRVFPPKAPRCTECKKKWSYWVIFGAKRNDMTYALRTPETKPKKGGATYAKWADSLPGVGAVASRLPNWPRWARILSTGVVIFLITVIIVWGFTKC